MIEVNNLTRLYGDFVAVNDVSFSIGQGGIVGLLGHNGAGKSTVMKMLSGHLDTTRGSVEIGGLDMATNRLAVQQNIGYLPENLPLYSELSVIDYLHYVAKIRHLSQEDFYTNIRYAIEATGLHEKLESTIDTLSRGFKQRVAVAQSILGHPKVLILDEPTNGLDPTQTQHMRDLIVDISKNTTVILSTHIMQEVDAICDRVLIMIQGSIALDSNLKDLQQSNSMSLHTTMPGTHATKMAREIAGLSKIELLAKHDNSAFYEYHLTLKEKQIANEVSAQVAKAIIEGGHSLYRLNTLKQDLETVFRQVNSNIKKETKDAA